VKFIPIPGCRKWMNWDVFEPCKDCPNRSACYFDPSAAAPEIEGVSE